MCDVTDRPAGSLPAKITRHMPDRCAPWCYSTDRHARYIKEMDLKAGDGVVECQRPVAEKMSTGGTMWSVDIIGPSDRGLRAEVRLCADDKIASMDAPAARSIAAALLRAADLLEGSFR